MYHSIHCVRVLRLYAEIVCFDCMLRLYAGRYAIVFCMLRLFATVASYCQGCDYVLIANCQIDSANRYATVIILIVLFYAF